MDEEQQQAFAEIKRKVVKPSVTTLSEIKVDFIYIQTLVNSKFASGSVLYQIQNGKPKVNRLCE